MSLNDDIWEADVSHQVDLERFAAGEWRRLRPYLVELEAELVAALVQNDPTAPKRSVFQQRRLEALLDETRRLIRNQYDALSQDQREALQDFAVIENRIVVNGLNTQIGVNVVTPGLTVPELRALVDETVVTMSDNSAGTIREWWINQGTGLQRQFAAAMRHGMLRDETLTQLTRRTQQVMGVARRHAETLVLSATNAVSNDARAQTYAANNDIIRGVAASVTLDTRTSAVCMARSGAAWNLADGRPLPESTREERYPGPPPWHARCRTYLVAVVRGFADMLRQTSDQPRRQRRLQTLSAEERAEMDGKIPRQTTYSEWLRHQPVAVQKDKLGQTRWELWTAGKLSIHDLVNQSGRPLTLEELAAAA